jgi:hypothetical protein
MLKMMLRRLELKLIDNAAAMARSSQGDSSPSKDLDDWRAVSPFDIYTMLCLWDNICCLSSVLLNFCSSLECHQVFAP